MAIYYEARSEPILGQLAVADVVMNTAKWKKEDVCKVVFRKGYLSSLSYKRRVPSNRNPAWRLAKLLAHNVLSVGRRGDVTKGANHFFRVGTHPWWEYATVHTITIKHHWFCKEVLTRKRE